MAVGPALLSGTIESGSPDFAARVLHWGIAIVETHREDPSIQAIIVPLRRLLDHIANAVPGGGFVSLEDGELSRARELIAGWTAWRASIR